MSMMPGATIGPYRIVEQIGRGGMATVYKAYQPALARYVAIKVLPAFFAEEASFRERFQQEAIAIAKLRHPNILFVFDFGAEGGVTYLVGEYVDGGTLAEQLGRALPLERTIGILAPVASALDYAHARGVLHRDVKPSNILLSRDGTPVLSDFGLARLMDAMSRLTRTGMALGTPEYMAPEQGAGEEVGPSADNYALAVVAYEMLTGRVPFSAETPLAVLLAHLHKPLPLPTSVNPALPEPVEAVLLKGLAKTPGDRYPTASEFVTALAEASRAPSPAAQRATAAVGDAASTEQAHAPAVAASGARDQGASAEPAAAAPAARSRRVRPGLALAAALLVLALAGGAFAVWHGGGSQRAAGATPTASKAPSATRGRAAATGATPRATTMAGAPATAPRTATSAAVPPPPPTATPAPPPPTATPAPPRPATATAARPSATAAPLATQVPGPFITRAGNWVAGGALSRVGADPAMVTLADGRLLAMGGYDPETGVVATAALYDPALRRWTPTGSMHVPRRYFTATVLRDGRVLVAGGNTGGAFAASAELYDPARGIWIPTGAMHTPRGEHVAALLPDGTVLVAGGDGAGYVPLVSAEIYNPATGIWRATGTTGTDHIMGAATVLRDGRVLVAGGDTREAEIYRPRLHAWEPAGALSVIRSGFTATVLRDGRVLVAGGENPDNNTTWATAEIYDPQARTWRATGAMARPATWQAAALLADGRVLVAGGQDGRITLASAQIYSPATGRWMPAGGMHQARAYAAATRLGDGTVLVAGGYAGEGVAGTFELFRPAR